MFSMKRPVLAAFALTVFCVTQSVASANKVWSHHAVWSQHAAEHIHGADPEFKEPEGGRPVQPVGKALWSGTSSLPNWVQLFFAFSWIGLVGCIPILIRKLGGAQSQTKTQMGLSLGLWVTLFGGLYLFTNIILFQSVHFDRIRPLTVIECIYLMSQMITTVGYGDITPAKPRGQVFVGLYVIGSLFVISMFISQLTEHIQKVAAEYQEKLREQTLQRSVSEDEEEEVPASPRLNLFAASVSPPDKSKFLKALAMFVMLDVIFIAFFCLWPGEGKTLMQAIYMSIITLSTVGFGAFTPVTESGMIFGAFMMLFGSAALVNLVGGFTHLMMQLHTYELREDHREEALKKLKENARAGANGKHQICDIDFLRFALVSQNLVKDQEIDSIMSAFQSLRPVDGKVPIEKLEAAVKQETDNREDAAVEVGK